MYGSIPAYLSLTSTGDATGSPIQILIQIQMLKIQLTTRILRAVQILRAAQILRAIVIVIHHQ